MVELVDICLESRNFGPASLRLVEGELVLLCGRSGSGKSTLCRLLCGREEPSDGSVHRDEDVRVGFLAHDFENQLLGATVGEELRLGRTEPVGCSLLEEALGEFVAPFFGRLESSPHTLSKAEQQVLLLYCLVRSGSRLLVLDESLSHLDPLQRESFLQVLGRLKAVGVSTLLVSHQSEVLGHVDRVVALAEGAVVYDGPPAEFSSSFFEQVGFLVNDSTGRASRGGISAPSDGRVSVVGPRGERLEFSAGQVHALGGFAGSGKTKVMECLFGFSADGGWSFTSNNFTRCFLRQTVGPSFWRGSVRQEWEVSCGSLGRLEPTLETLYRGLIPDTWWGRAPQQLSHGQLRFFGALCLLAQAPLTVFLDQPFLGLDGVLRTGLSQALEGYLQGGGRAVMACDGTDLVERWADIVVWLENGECRWWGTINDPNWRALTL